MKKLTNEELVELYQIDGNELAFEELYKRNQGLIHKVINKFSNVIVISKEDVKSACVLGFVRAAKAYSKDNKCKFSSYCYIVMVNEVNTSLNSASRKMRNDLNRSFCYLDENVNDGEGSKLIDIIDMSGKDVLYKEDYTYLHNAVEYAKGFIMDKYYPYLIPLTLKETSIYKVAPLIDVSPKTVHYTMKRFRKYMQEYITKYMNYEIVS
ncbi:RNA polymerase sigma factor [Lysinibacillus sp. BPa_S21]|uniref:RNA polymerase sigma factor n=1 Tax=Lysinibacillus sp. BPa_S21 TaxID=2932478 RepID=UPI002011C701|nr:sigma factor [Lysinibacillus sp. BPa_S21]MCL1696378.1 hypothetical protein [Lysinibacillus sp. BPa_S21]